MRALIEKKPVLVRNPQAIRPWQHVLECLSGYLWLAARLSQESKASPFAGPFNFGPQTSSRQPVARLVTEFLKTWPGAWKDASDPSDPHEATLLSLSIEKAAALLHWHPSWDFTESVQRTAVWYQRRHAASHSDMLEFSTSQIDDYVETANSQGLSWAVAR